MLVKGCRDVERNWICMDVTMRWTEEAAKKIEKWEGERGKLCDIRRTVVKGRRGGLHWGTRTDDNFARVWRGAVSGDWNLVA